MQTSNASEMIRFGDKVPEQAERPLGQAILRGVKCQCPACGSGKLFRAYLKPVDNCGVCGEDMTPQRADDLPPYLVIIILGHLIVGSYMMVDMAFPMPTWLALTLWGGLTVVLAFLLIQPVKGGVIGLQWALRMHGFGDSNTDEFEH